MLQSFRKIVKNTAHWLLVGITIVACGKESPISTKLDSVPELQNTFTKTTEQMVFLQAKTNRLQKIFTATAEFDDDGGRLVVGDEISGYTGILIPEDAVTDEVDIYMTWDSQNYLVDFEPHGLQFKKPVLLRISYKDAILSNVSEDRLRIWYYNEETNLWEYIGGTVDREKKVVKAYITHFSRYGVGAE